MSLYTLVNGVNPCTFYILPMLGKHPNEYPRFMDCFASDPDHPEYDNHIHVYTRTGGGNRREYEEQNEAMRQMDGFVASFDDKADHTFASWVFEVPKKWKPDFDKLMAGERPSDEYIEEMKRVYPKLADLFDMVFRKGGGGDVKRSDNEEAHDGNHGNP